MRNKKFKLNDFHVQSFITKLDASKEFTVKGGATYSPCTREETEAGFCPEKLAGNAQTDFCI